MRIRGTDIEMIRGDTEVIEVTLVDSEEGEIPFEEGSTIYFTVKDDIRREEYAFQKKITEFTEDGKAIIKIYPYDTHFLQPRDSYVYDIQLTDAEKNVTTLVGPSNFSLIGDVTRD